MSRLKRNYTYTVGDIVNALPNYTLTCTKAGVTSADPITVQEGIIIDGTCEWNCVNNGGAVEDWRENTVYLLNDLIVHDGTLYICKQEHTSSNSFTTDWLSGKWGLIGKDSYSNATYTRVFSGTAELTTSHQTFNLDLPVSDGASQIYNLLFIAVRISTSSFVRWNTYATRVFGESTSAYTEWRIESGSYYASFTLKVLNDGTFIAYISKASSPAPSIQIRTIDALKVNTMTLSEIAELSMPSDVYETIEHKYTNSNTSWETTKFVAPADGYLFTRINARPGGFVNLNTMYAGSQFGCNTSNANASMCFLYGQLPLKKGQTGFVRILNCYSSPDDCVRFYYTVGSAKELGLV